MPDISRVFAEKGWVGLPFDQETLDWVTHVAPIAAAISRDENHRRDWLRHGETWFAGVNLLPNDRNGRVAGGPELPKPIRKTLKNLSLPMTLDKGQISVTYPGYPQRDVSESDAAFRYRNLRDAAHVDGLLPIGPDRRRYLKEPHAFVLGIPLGRTDPGASPMVIWEGSHHEISKNFRRHIAENTAQSPDMVDLTDMYHQIRSKIFRTCPRVAIHAQPGETYLVHRLALHGVSPWENGAKAPEEGRMIVYFRPEIGNLNDWLSVG